MCLAGCLPASPHRSSSCPQGIESFTPLYDKACSYCMLMYFGRFLLSRLTIFNNISLHMLHNCVSSSIHSNHGSVRHTHMIKLNECLSGMIWLTEHSCRGFIQRLTNPCFNSDGDGKGLLWKFQLCFSRTMFYGRDEMSRGANSSLVARVKVKAKVFTAQFLLHKDVSENIDNGNMHSSHLVIIQILWQGATFRERYRPLTSNE